MKKRVLMFLVGCAVAFTAPVAMAQTALSDLIKVDVLDGGQAADGSYLTALRLNLSKGWKTYWRAPGDAGIPPQFDWSAAENVARVDYVWPTPSVFDQNGMRSIGYHDQLVLPVKITPKNAARDVQLTGKIDIGLCKDICIPATLSVNHELDRNAPRHPAIAAAMAQRPYSPKEAGVKSASCRLSPIDGGMQIEARITLPHTGGRETAVIEPGSAAIWASETETRRSGNVLTATSDLIQVNGGAFALDRSTVRITVLGKNHAVDIVGCAPG